MDIFFSFLKIKYRFVVSENDLWRFIDLNL